MALILPVATLMALHLHWQRRVSAVGLPEQMNWIVQPVTQDRLKKAIRRLLPGGEEENCRWIEVYLHATRSSHTGFI